MSAQGGNPSSASNRLLSAEFIWLGVAGAQARVGGKAEVVEDVQGLLPGVAGRIEIAGGMVGIAEMAQSGG